MVYLLSVSVDDMMDIVVVWDCPWFAVVVVLAVRLLAGLKSDDSVECVSCDLSVVRMPDLQNR